MKIRLCDSCKSKIEGRFVKCCESYMIDKQQKLNHIGDLCLSCWNKIFKGEVEE